MPVYPPGSKLPESVGRSELDQELTAWVRGPIGQLQTGIAAARLTMVPVPQLVTPESPVLGADEPIAVQRASHAVLGAKPWPEIGSVETLVSCTGRACMHALSLPAALTALHARRCWTGPTAAWACGCTGRPFPAARPCPRSSTPTAAAGRAFPAAPTSSFHTRQQVQLCHQPAACCRVGTLDEFEVPMRLLAERAGIATYVVGYKLAPEQKWPGHLDEVEYVVRWLFEHAQEQGVDETKVGSVLF